MASTVTSQTDQEMTVFFGATHVDNLDAYYKLLRAMLLEPENINLNYNLACNMVSLRDFDKAQLRLFVLVGPR